MGFEIQKARAVAEFGQLTGNAQEVLGQLFLNGPTWDGNIISKTGRSELVGRRIAFRVDGWTYLSETGVIMAISVNVGAFSDQRWHRKQNKI